MNGISGLSAYYAFSGSPYGTLAAQRAAQVNGKIPAVTAKKAAQPEAPVERVRPAAPINANAAAQASRPLPTWNLDAGDEAVRMRIQQPGSDTGNAQTAALPGSNTAKDIWPGLPGSSAESNVAAASFGLSGSSAQSAFPGLFGGNTAQAAFPTLPGSGTEAAQLAGDENAWAGLPNYPGVDAGESATRLRIQYPGNDSKTAAQAGAADGTKESVDADGEKEPVGAAGVQKAVEDGKCETCEQRKYQDGSDDPGVSYQTPTRISPESAPSAVRGHEMEHVVREQAKAQREDRRVVSQSVTLHTDICPECGKVYISGGTTRTVTASNPTEPEPAQKEQEQKQPNAPAGLV